MDISNYIDLDVPANNTHHLHGMNGPREWVFFETSADGGDSASGDADSSTTWAFDLTFLNSRYNCIYGRGCPGILTESAPVQQHGCCTYGAYLSDADDRHRVEARAAQLSANQWQLADEAKSLGGPLQRNTVGDWVTRVVDDACIFLNRIDHPGGPGCALHQAAVAHGEREIDWKPDICWQVPLRLDEHIDDLGHRTMFLRDWKRRDWGDGGADFGWWCTDDTLAFSADRPVWRLMRDEIVEMVGEEPYRMLVDYILSRHAVMPLPRRRVAGASDGGERLT